MAKPRTLDEALRNLNQVLRFMARHEVLIGIPGDGPKRGDSELTDSQLGYIHEHGAPEANIPARPFLAPGMERSEAMIVAELRRAADKAVSLAVIEGDVAAGKAAVTDGLARIGLKAVSNVKAVITAGIEPPLSERTVYARMHRKKNRRRAGSMTPLIDTGELLRSIKYIIRG